LVERIVQGKRDGLSAAAIASRLNAEGFQPPSGKTTTFKEDMVRNLFLRIGVSRVRRPGEHLAADEWWLRDLAEALAIPVGRLRHWLEKGYVRGRKSTNGHYVIVWADADELDRLRRLRDYWTREQQPIYPKELTEPKRRVGSAYSSETKARKRTSKETS